jgi:hypothetical protein
LSYSGISDFGFVDHCLCPRFACGAMSALVDPYAGFRLERALVEEESLYGYLFAAGPRRLVSLFAPRSKTRALTRSDAAAASLVDAMGNAKPLRAARRVALTVSDYPTTVLLGGALYVTLSSAPASPLRLICE